MTNDIDIYWSYSNSLTFALKTGDCYQLKIKLFYRYEYIYIIRAFAYGSNLPVTYHFRLWVLMAVHYFLFVVAISNVYSFTIPLNLCTAIHIYFQPSPPKEDDDVTMTQGDFIASGREYFVRKKTIKEKVAEREQMVIGDVLQLFEDRET